jgi:hypothetical protein
MSSISIQTCSNLNSRVRTAGVINDPLRERRPNMTLPPLPQSADKSAICTRLGLNEHTHKLLLVSLNQIFEGRPLTLTSPVERSRGCSQRIELELLQPDRAIQNRPLCFGAI